MQAKDSANCSVFFFAIVNPSSLQNRPSANHASLPVWTRMQRNAVATPREADSTLPPLHVTLAPSRNRRRV